MPRKSIVRRKPRKRTYKRKSRIARTPRVGLFGATTVARKLRYVDVDTLTNVAGALTSQLFSCNGAYDPDYTGGGHQPLWFDQIMPYFQHFCVLRSTIVATFSYNGTPSIVPVNVGIAVRGTSTTSATAQLYIENGGCKWATLLPAAESSRTVKMSFDTKKFFGKKYAVDNYDLKGTILANPQEDAYFHVFTDPLTGAGTPSIDVQCVIHYSVVFSEPIPVAGS